MLDEHGYPDEASLKAIEEYDVTNQPVKGLLDLIHDNWQYADSPGWHGYHLYHLVGKRVLKLRLDTGGWSGNENVIEAMRKNFLFWSLTWQQSNRGGHYRFVIKLSNFKGGERC